MNDLDASIHHIFSLLLDKENPKAKQTYITLPAQQRPT